MLGVRLSSHHWFVVGHPGKKHTTMKKTRLENQHDIYASFPFPWPERTVQFLTISYSISYFYLLSNLLQMRKYSPVFMIFCTILASHFLMAQFKCPWLGLATTPSRPNPSLAGLRHGSRGELRLFNVHICKCWKHEIIEAWVETMYIHAWNRCNEKAA